MSKRDDTRSKNVTFANATFTYEFILENDEVLKGATLRIKIGPEKTQPAFPESQIKCDLKSVFTLITTNDGVRPKIFWADDIFGPNGNALLLLDDQDGIPRDIALIQVHKHDTWIARSEPTQDNRLAITVANQKNKVLLMGIGDIVEVELVPHKPKLPPKKGHQLIATLHESYKWKQTNPGGCNSCAGSVRTTSPSAMPDYSAPDGGSCFAAGTLVMMADNVTKPIEKLRIGDLVLARDEETGRTTTRRIRHVWMHNVQSTLILQLANGEQIETTPRHQFALASTGFVDAGSLNSESKLVTHTKSIMQIVEMKPRANPAVVYNLEVEEFHTYFVGKTGMWVHNARKQDVKP